MPEGHTIHRAARLHRDAFGGRSVRASSPQGRFNEGAARLDGATLTTVDAYGKHLFYRFSPTGTLHIHLGLFGRFRLFRNDPPAPTPGTRLTLAADGGPTLYLAGATAVEIIDDEEEQRLRARLGPDPLHDHSDGKDFAAALGRRSVGIGQALLDQGAIAGVGNVYRSEVLFLEGIHPDRPARTLPPPAVAQLWDRIRALLRRGERSGRIVTVEPGDRDRPPSRLRRDEALYVYKRAGLACRRCGATITSWELGGRTVFACPEHQRRP